MTKMIKTILGVLLASFILVGAYAGYQAVEGYLDGKIAAERGKYEAVVQEYKEYKGSALYDISILGEEIVTLKSENLEYEAEGRANREEITIIHTSITELEKAAIDLTDISNKYDNAMLQITEYKKIVFNFEQNEILYEARLITKDEIIAAQDAVIKDWKQLYLNAEHLHGLCRNQLSATEKRLTWEKTKFKGGAVLLLAAGGFVLYNEVTK